MKEADPVFASIEKWLAETGRPRTRENFLRASFEELPDEWDDEAEELNLPADLRLIPAPPYPLAN